ncbi:MAG: diguanylate cyclase [Thermoleophilaceae bacterium]
MARELSLLLEPASTAKAACRAVVDWLAADAAFMPSIYLERGGRLRCQAVTRYWQVFDGIPPGTGVIGQTFQSGTPTIVADTGASDDYLEAVPSVRGEACVPMRTGGQVIGVLNVESERPLPDAVADTLTWCAELLGRRIEELGGQPLESRAQRLARHASHLSTLRHAGAILGEVTVAACDIAGMESALLAFPEADERSDPVAHGPHAERLAALAPAALRQVAEWVESMTSVYTIGEPAGRGFAGHEVLRQAGAEAIVELLELLAAQAGSALQTAHAITDLHERAAQDPLTELGHQVTFQTCLQEACRQQRSFSLMVVDVDSFKAVNDSLGHRAGDDVLVRCATVLGGELREGDRLFRIGGDEFAVLLERTDESEAHALGERLRASIAALGGPTVSIGVAAFRPREHRADLFGRADGALYEVKRRGRNGVAVG